MTIPLTMPLPTQLQPPTRTCWSERSSAAIPEGVEARGPYLALLPVGLAMPPLLPAARWALTPPFHPYLTLTQSKPWSDRRSIFCGAFRRVTPPGRYPAPFLSGVRTFLPDVLQHQSGHPAFRARSGLRARAMCGQWVLALDAVSQREICGRQRPCTPRRMP